MPTFARSVLIDAPVETVFQFHERQDALSLLTPSFPPVRIVNQSGGIQPGARAELRVVFLPWIALHTVYERNQFFVDEQVEGPFVKWIHRHEFEDLGVAMRLTDRVEFLLPGGVLVNAALGWIVKLGLDRMFIQRHRLTKQLCEKP